MPLTSSLTNMNLLASNAFYRPICGRWLHTSSVSNSLPQESPEARAKANIVQQLEMDIKLPKKKTWSKTAILEALAGTVGTAVKPFYYEPHSPRYWQYGIRAQQRKANMAKIGRSTANYVINDLPEVFQTDWEAGDMEKWLDTSKEDTFGSSTFLENLRHPTETIKEQKVNLQDSIESLEQLVEEKELERMIEMFLRLRNDGVEIPTALFNHFLGMFAFYKGNFKYVSDFEESAMKKVVVSNYHTRSVSGTTPLITDIFESIETPSITQLSVWILCLHRFHDQLEISASLFFNKICKNYTDVKLDIKVYNHILLNIAGLNQNYQLALRVLKHMKSQGVKPNYLTFCNFARILPGKSITGLTAHFAKILLEMKELGIKWGPAIFDSMMHVSVSRMFTIAETEKIQHAILDFIEGMNFTIQHPTDVTVFYRMLSKTKRDLSAAKKILNLSQCGTNNSIMYHDYLFQYRFFKDFLAIVKERDTIDNLFYYYQLLFPLRIHLNWNTILSLIEHIRTHRRPEFLPIVQTYIPYMRPYYDTFNLLLEVAIDLYGDTDEDTKTQLKHIAMIELKFCKNHSIQPLWNNIVNMCVEIVLLSEDHQALEKSLQWLIEAGRKRKPILSAALQAKCEHLANERSNKEILKALEKLRNIKEYKKKKSHRVDKNQEEQENINGDEHELFDNAKAEAQ